MTNAAADWIAIGIHVLLAVSINIVSGYARQLSLGHMAFAAIGAYASTLFVASWRLSFWLACPLSILLSASVAAVLGAPVLRAARYYIPVMTFTLNALIVHLLRLGRLLGEPVEIGRMPRLQLLERELSAPGYLALVAAAIACCLLVDWRFRHSAMASELAKTTAHSAGESRPRRALATYVALILSAAIAGLAGALLAHAAAFIGPFDFDIETSLFVLGLAAFGGLGFLPGVLISAIGVSWLLEQFQDLSPYRLWFAGASFILASWGWPWLRRQQPHETEAKR